MNVITTNEVKIRSLGTRREVVYDIEVEDNHNFFANNILVHNSNYIELKGLIDKWMPNRTRADDDKIVDFIDKIMEERVLPYIKTSYEELAEYTHAYENKMNMSREIIASVGFWTRKKRYALLIHDNERVRYAKPKTKIVGLETVRVATPDFCKARMKEAISIIFHGTEQEAVAHYDNTKIDFMNLTIEEIGKVVSVKNMEKYAPESEYELCRKGTTQQIKAVYAHNAAVERLGLTDKIEPMTNGDKVKLVVLKEPNPLKSSVIGWKSHLSLPKEFDIESLVDRESMFNLLYRGPIQAMYGTANWKPEKPASLLDLLS